MKKTTLLGMVVLLAVLTAAVVMLTGNGAPAPPGTGKPAPPTTVAALPPVTGVPPRAGEASFQLRPVAEGFTSPVAMDSPRDGSGRLFIVDQIGLVKVLTRDGGVLEQPFLDLRDRMVTVSPAYDERGLLGLAFHPAFKNNGRLFVHYSAPLRAEAPAGWNHTGRISEFRVSVADPNLADAASERVVLEIDQPQGNHNGGQIVFGPDGFLYIPLGDGGMANDVGVGHAPGGNGQDTSTLLGKILRIDTNTPQGYGIPADNPALDAGARREILSFGFRNPFRISFDAAGEQELFVADVGQNLWEEVNIVTKGNNHGWRIREGRHCFDPSSPNQSPELCADVDALGRPLIDPIIEYQNARSQGGGVGLAVIGGFVYRGKALPGLQGRYVFGDFSASQLAPRHPPLRQRRRLHLHLRLRLHLHLRLRPLLLLRLRPLLLPRQHPRLSRHRLRHRPE